MNHLHKEGIAMKYTDRQYRTSIIPLLALLCILFGCASTPETPFLDKARIAYSKAKNDPDVSKYAPIELYEAKVALDKAGSAEKREEREHHAYIAHKLTEKAVVLTERHKAEQNIDEYRWKRQDIIMEQREMEIKKAKEEATRARDKVAMLEKELAGLRTKKTDRGLMVTIEGVLFEVDKANLLPGAMRAIDQISSFLKNHPDYNAAVEGHTDNTGPAEYNQQLSMRRAESVAAALQTRGIGEDRLSVKGLGENYPVAGNDTAAGRQQNRRVEIVLMQK